jgi:hypothetical protein
VLGWKKWIYQKFEMPCKKTMTWTKKLGKGRQKWELAWKEIGLKPWKLKTLVKIQFASKVVCIQETLEYATTINLCYSQQTSRLQTWIPFGLTWAQTLGPVAE